MLMMLGSCRWIGKAFATDAHDAGLLPVEWKKALQLMLMMPRSCWWIGKYLATDAHDAGPLPLDWKRTFATDAHDAGFLPVDWKKAVQLMLMMLGSWRRIRKKRKKMLGSCRWTEKALQLMLMMLGTCRWIGKILCN